ncbi:phage tail spike protein [Abyssicoccus albus]|uniref:Phage minor structural protein n=1 Tax=Abyssicoccus albus TaxID=1817405 RepID=A0A3N5BBE7_9BACL|nr:phage tail spike protein [Abyssicoccus albus]RPF54727.1 phage minor structural protein [Abyssicoccus albus]
MIYLFDSKKQLNKIIPRNNIIEALQTIELNGLYTFYMELPLFHKTNKGQIFNHKKSVDNATFIGHFDKQDRFQLYKIHDRIVQDDSLIVEGVHLFFDEALAGDIIRDKRPTDDTADVACDVAFNGIGWRVTEYDITTPKSTNFYYESPSECRTKILETWNVELDYSLTFDGQKIVSKNIHVKNKLGEWTGKRFAYGSNVLQIRQEQSDAEIVTAVIGRGKGEEVGDGYGRRVNLANMSWSNDVVKKPYAQDYIELPSATDQYGYYENGVLKPRLQVVVFEDIENRRELAQATYEYLIQNCVPKVSYETDVVSVGDLNLGDEVGIIYKEIDILRKARVQKLEVNLLNTELTKISLGDYQYFKEDKAKINLQKKIDRVEQDTVDYITQLKLAFDTEYNAQTEYIEDKFNEAVDTAQAEVKSAETRMNTVIDNTRKELENDISTAKQDAIEQSETNAKSLTDSVRTDLNSAESRINTSLSDLGNDISDVDTKVVNVSNDLATKVDKSIYDTTISDLKTSDTSIKKDIANAKKDLSNAKTDISNAQNLLEEHGTKIDSHDVEITNVKGQLSSKASQTSLDSLKGTVDKHTTSITQNANDIKTKANQSTVDTLNQTVTNQNTLISQNANEIKSKAEKAYVDTINNTVEKNSTLISQTSEKLQLTAKSIDNMKIGGRNLLEDSANIKKVYGESFNSLTYIYRVDMSHINDKVSFGDEITISFDVQMQKGLSLRAYDSNGQIDKSFGMEWFKNIGTNRQRLSFTKTLKDPNNITGSWILDFYNENDENDDFIIENIKIEKGNIATEWSPAPEDLEKEVEKNKAAIELTSKEIALKVDSSVVNDLKGIVDRNSTSIVQNANDIKSKASQSTVDSISNTVSNHTTLINQNADNVKITASKIDNLSVGGRNYIKNSNNFEKYTPYTGYTRTITQNYTVEEWNTSDATRLTYVPNSNISKNPYSGLSTTPRIYGVGEEEMTFSYWVKNLGDKPFKFRYNGFSANNVWLQPGEQKRIISTGVNNVGTVSFQHQIYPESVGDTVDVALWRVKLEKGNIATDWTPAPEDIESEVETNRAELNVQADEIAGLVQKTSGHDTVISNLSQRADNINLSVADLEKWKTTAQSSIDVNSQAITNEVWKRDINSATNTLNQSINQVKQTAEGNKTTIQNQISRIDRADDWIATNGQTVIENADMFERKVWNADIEAIEVGGRNLIPNSDFSKGLDGWSIPYGSTATKDNEKNDYMFSNTAGRYVGVRTPTFDVVAGQTYTLTIEGSRGSNMQQLNYVYMMYDISGVPNQPLSVKSFSSTLGEFTRVSVTFTATNTKVGGDILIAKRPNANIDSSYLHGFYIRNVKLEKGDKATDWTPAVEDTVQHSEVKLLSDGFSIGTTKVGGDTFASAIVGNKDGLALIGDNVDVSNNLTVKNTITSEAIKAVRADFASVTTAYLTSNIIDTNMLKSEVVDASKLKVDSALVNKISANSIFANDIKTKAISAVHADLKSVSSEIMETNILKSEWLQVDNALFDRITSNSAFIDKLTSKSAFIRDIKSIDLSADRITGGVLRSLDNTMKFDLNKNHLEFFGNSTIDFYDSDNMFRMIYPSTTRDDRDVIVGFGMTGLSNGSNVAYFGGGHYNIDGTIRVNDEGFAGLRIGGGSNDARLTGTNVEIGSGNEPNDMYFKFDFENSDSSRYARFRPPSSADNYVLGGSNTPFHSIYSWRINRLRFTNLSGDTELRFDNGDTTGAGFRFTRNDVYFVRGGLFSIKQTINRAESAYDSINASNGLREQIRSLATRVSALER